MKHLIYETYDSIALVKINRPQVLNALNREVLTELNMLLDLLEVGQQTKALILTGEGEKAFIAGADIKEMQGMGSVEMRQFSELGQRLTNKLENASFLTIAAVNGYALGGGLEVALACDFIYASQTAKLGLPEVTLGIIPGFGGTQRLSRTIGTRLAKELIMSGTTITAEQALQYGIVNHISAPGSLLDDCTKAAQNIIRN